ncbi:kinase-like domain-containing protein [Syncephalis plumigaleata]|nr:kinase-like domain-containing protein [Syncephalis plumigaleata]
MSVSTSTTTESLSSEHLSDSLYVNVPQGWSQMSNEDKRKLVGWVEIRDAKTAEYKEYMLPVGTTVKIGLSSTERDCRINIGGPPDAYFELVAARNGITFKSKEKEWTLTTWDCFRTSATSPFPDAKLQPTRVNENINDEEFKEWAEENCIMTETRLGEGGQGSVYLGVDRRTKEYVAIKSFRRGNDQDTAAREASILKELRGYPYFIQMVGKCITSRNTYIVLQHAWGDLDRYIDLHGTVPEECAKTIFKQLLEGIKIMHDNYLVHRDIKPGNILLLEFSQAPTAVYADFGLTKQLVSPVALLTSCVGTPGYMAPEVLKTHPDWDLLELKEKYPAIAHLLDVSPFTKNGYSKASDMWSLGITLFQMLFGGRPFETDGMELISNLLVVDADKRYTVDDALECAWLTEPEVEGESLSTASTVEEASQSTEITVELTLPSTESVVEISPPIEPAVEEVSPPTPSPRPPKRNWRLPDPPTRAYYSRKAKRGPINYKW